MATGTIHGSNLLVYNYSGLPGTADAEKLLIHQAMATFRDKMVIGETRPFTLHEANGSAFFGIAVKASATTMFGIMALNYSTLFRVFRDSSADQTASNLDTNS